MLITKRSNWSGNINTREIPCTQEQWDAWCGGEKIQDVMPNVSPEDREFLISGLTPEEWAVMEEELDDEDE